MSRFWSRHARIQGDEKAAAPETSTPIYPSADLAKQVSFDETLARNLEAVREAEKRETARIMAQTEEAKGVLAAVESRRREAEKAGLPAALCWFFEEVRHYPAWSKRNDAEKWIKLPELGPWEAVEDPESRRPNDTRLRFTLEGNRFELRFHEYGNYGPEVEEESFGKLELLDSSSAVVLSVGVSRPWLSDYDPWRPTSVDAYRPGYWAIALVSLHSRGRLAETKRYADERSGAKKLDELKANFDLK